MSNVKLQIYFQSQSGETFKKTLTYINPNVSDEVLMRFVTALNDLTTNKLGDVYKVVNDFLGEVNPPVEDNTLITAEEIENILNGEYIEVFDGDGITEIEINSILDGTYEPIEDSGGITQSDIDDIFSEWED